MTTADNHSDLIDSVAIDGPAGSGKSSVAKRVAEARGYLYVDTGAMYRAVALKAMRQDVDMEDPEAMANVAAGSEIGFDETGTRILLDGEDVSADIRSPEVARNVKCAARVPAIRARMVSLQRAMAEKRPVVMEGRDINTVVLPRARWKYFLTASPEVRAERRHAEMRAAGREVELATILEDINQRDAADYQVGPMKEARDRAMVGDGIHYLDTSELTPDEVVMVILDSMDGDQKKKRKELPSPKGIKQILGLNIVIIAILLAGIVCILHFQPSTDDFPATPPSGTVVDIRAAAEAGDADSQYVLGTFYGNGQIVSQDFVEAAKWHRLAATQGHARAQTCLAWLYDYGLGVERDRAEAAKWYLAAAGQGDAAAHMGVAALLFSNRQSAFPKSFRWPMKDGRYVLMGGFDHWVTKGLALARSAPLFSAADNFRKNYSRQHPYHQSNVILVKAIETKAIKGDHEAWLDLALLNLPDVLGGMFLKDKLPTLLRDSARSGNLPARFALLNARRADIILPVERSEQDEWKDGLRTYYAEPFISFESFMDDEDLTAAAIALDSEGKKAVLALAEQGFSPAQYVVGKYHDLFELDLTTSLRWMTAAAEQGNQEARVELIIHHLKGEETGRHQDEINDWLEGIIRDSDAAPMSGLLARLPQALAVKRDAICAEYESRSASSDGIGSLMRGLIAVAEAKNDLPAGREWFSKAYTQGQPAGAYLLGCIAQLGRIHSPPPELLEHYLNISLPRLPCSPSSDGFSTQFWFYLAAEQGYVPGICSLLIQYMDGTEYERDLLAAEAMEYWTRRYFHRDDWHLSFEGLEWPPFPDPTQFKGTKKYRFSTWRYFNMYYAINTMED